MARTVEIVKAEIERAKANKKRRSHLEAELNVLMSRRVAEAIASNGNPVVLNLKTKAERIHDELKAEIEQRRIHAAFNKPKIDSIEVAPYDPAEYAGLPEEEENKHTLLYTFLLAAEVIVIFVLFRYLRWL